ncbi:hypothetical protein BpHYR1_004189 [Brachionus plicatilis]|uniref:Uncharacterized protein n=1 Tax=Brachionus plicatilis TaxID=10195 RepID=A0A3M7SYE9_BRAPC|nr:hypothetical protein BpHYR1_004189 [Brachionus plicatilis]
MYPIRLGELWFIYYWNNSCSQLNNRISSLKNKKKFDRWSFGVGGLQTTAIPYSILSILCEGKDLSRDGIWVFWIVERNKYLVGLKRGIKPLETALEINVYIVYPNINLSCVSQATIINMLEFFLKSVYKNLSIDTRCNKIKQGIIIFFKWSLMNYHKN